MHILFQLAIGISLITLAGGTIGYIIEDGLMGGGPTFGGCFILLAAWAAMVFMTFMTNGETEKKRRK